MLVLFLVLYYAYFNASIIRALLQVLDTCSGSLVLSHKKYTVLCLYTNVNYRQDATTARENPKADQ